MTEFILAFLIAIIVGLGVGGGGFFVIYLTLCLNYPQLIAQGTNLLFFLICSVSSLFIHLKKRKVSPRLLVPIILMSVPGTIAGSYLASVLPPRIPRLLLGIVLALGGGISIIKMINVRKIKK